MSCVRMSWMIVSRGWARLAAAMGVRSPKGRGRLAGGGVSRSRAPAVHLNACATGSATDRRPCLSLILQPLLHYHGEGEPAVDFRQPSAVPATFPSPWNGEGCPPEG